VGASADGVTNKEHVSAANILSISVCCRVCGMTTDNREPNVEEKWVDFDPANTASNPKDDFKVFVVVASGKTGPAIYHDRTGFALFNAPWGDLGAVKQWQYREW
jgi:hypothetical protein